MSFFKYFRKIVDDIVKIVFWWRLEGFVVIDWESWKFQWDRNWGNRMIYKNYFLVFIRNYYFDWLEMKVKIVV